MSLAASSSTPAMRSTAAGGIVYARTILCVALLLRLGVVAMVLLRYPQDWLFSKAPDLGMLANF